MKQEPEFFADKDARLIYIGRRLGDALKVEEILTAAGIDYGVEPDTYQGGIIFRTERVGAFFYVLPELEESARAVLVENRFRPAPPSET